MGAGAGGAIPAFAVEVTLSPRAAARLQAASEGIVVSASYYGNATRAARRRANPMGQINLAARDVAIPGRGGTARFPAIPVSPALLNGIVNRRPEVLVNVFSARRSGPDNLLDCGIFQDRRRSGGGAGRDRLQADRRTLIPEPRSVNPGRPTAAAPPPATG